MDMCGLFQSCSSFQNAHQASDFAEIVNIKILYSILLYMRSLYFCVCAF